MKNYEMILKDYPTISNFEITSLDNIVNNVKQKIELFNKLIQQ